MHYNYFKGFSSVKRKCYTKKMQKGCIIQDYLFCLLVFFLSYIRIIVSSIDIHG